MLRPGTTYIRFHIAAILTIHWEQFVERCSKWIRPVVFENVLKVLACRTPVLGCHVYQCKDCSKVEIIPHSCKSRFCPTCGKHATDVWADGILNNLLDVPYHHVVLTIPWQLRTIILCNRKAGLNLLARAACEAIQQWARDTKNMRMGIIAVIHTFGSDIKWNPHIHLIVTGGGLSLDGNLWIETDPKFLMHHKGLKQRWKYQVITSMKAAHRKKVWRYPKSVGFLKQYPFFAAMLNKLWKITWYAYIGASLLDPRFGIKYIGRYTKRAVMAEYRIVHYDGKIVRFSYKDYAKDSKTSYKTMKVDTFIGRLITHIPDKHFPMVRHSGLFANRWKQRYLTLARDALNQQPSADDPQLQLPWAERQEEYTGTSPLVCPDCDRPMECIGIVFGKWVDIQIFFWRAGSREGLELEEFE